MKKALYSIAAVLTAVLFSSCKQETVEDYIILSRLSYTFSNAEDSIVIGVKSNKEWKAESDSDHFTVSKRGTDSAVIKAIPSSEGAAVSGNIQFMAGDMVSVFKVDQLPASFDGRFVDYDLTSYGAISPLGKYAAYVYYEMGADGNYIFHASKINVETGEEETIEIPESGGESYDGVLGISDDGETLIFVNFASVNSKVYRNGELVELKLPDGYTSPSPQAMSSDGSVIVGFCMDPNYMYRPMRWSYFGTEYEELEFPTENVGQGDIYPGTMARGCSADGSVVYGSEWLYMGLVYWKDGKLHNLGVEYGEVDKDSDAYKKPSARLVMFSDNFKMSPNGRYIAASYKDDLDPENKKEYPALIDTETGDVKMLPELNGVVGLAVSDDGVVFGGTPSFNITQGVVIDFDSKTSIPLSEWFADKYGLTIEDDRFVYYTPAEGVFYGRKYFYNGMSAFFPMWLLTMDK